MSQLTIVFLFTAAYLGAWVTLGVMAIRQAKTGSFWRFSNPVSYLLIVVTAFPLWFFLGYLVSPTYSEFRAGCARDIELYVVRPYPTGTTYGLLCHEVRQAVFDRDYDRGVCPRNRRKKEAVLIRRIVPAPSDCNGPRDDACFVFEPTRLPLHAYTVVLSNFKRFDNSLFADSMTRVQADYVDQRGELMAYRQIYAHSPHGSLSTLTGLLTGRKKSRCIDVDSGTELMRKLYPPEQLTLPR